MPEKKTYELLYKSRRDGKTVLRASGRTFSGSAPGVAAKHAARKLCKPGERKHIYLRRRDGKKEQTIFHYIGSCKKVKTERDAPKYVSRPYHIVAKAKRVGKVMKRELKAGDVVSLAGGEAAPSALEAGKKHRRSRRSKARRSKARRSKTRRSKARRSKARRSKGRRSGRRSRSRRGRR
jgi:hypothetical protein